MSPMTARIHGTTPSILKPATRGGIHMNPTFANRVIRPAAAGGMLACALAIAALQTAMAAPGGEPALVRVASDAGLQWGACPDFLPPGCAIAVLHGDPTQPNVDIFFRVPANSDIAPHTHTSAERMVLVAGEMQVSYEGQPAATLTTGAYAYGPAGRPHSARCVSDVPCVLFIAFESALDAIPVGNAAN
jgi:mannose-6-phosphate isomerase-like protein (cupin superfamily)